MILREIGVKRCEAVRFVSAHADEHLERVDLVREGVWAQMCLHLQCICARHGHGPMKLVTYAFVGAWKSVSGLEFEKGDCARPDFEMRISAWISGPVSVQSHR